MYNAYGFFYLFQFDYDTTILNPIYDMIHLLEISFLYFIYKYLIIYPSEFSLSSCLLKLCSHITEEDVDGLYSEEHENKGLINVSNQSMREIHYYDPIIVEVFI